MAHDLFDPTSSNLDESINSDGYNLAEFYASPTGTRLDFFLGGNFLVYSTRSVCLFYRSYSVPCRLDGVGYRITSDKYTKFLENAPGATHPLFLLYRVDTKKCPAFMTE